MLTEDTGLGCMQGLVMNRGRSALVHRDHEMCFVFREAWGGVQRDLLRASGGS
jgi:hypothetical protein